MKRIEFTPKACKGTETEPALFEGKIVLRVPTLPERYEILEKLGFQYDADGNVKMEKGMFSILKILISESEKFYETVDIKKLSDGTRYASFDDLVSDPDCDGIVNDVANEIKQGFKPPKK